jgi:hypothetical protein
VVIASFFWSVLALATLVGFALGMIALLISNTFGSRVQSILMWLVLLLVGLVWLVSSVAFVTSDTYGWWWVGVVLAGGVVGIASISLWRLRHAP